MTAVDSEDDEIGDDEPATGRGTPAMIVEVAAGDDGIRIDRWLKRHRPELAHATAQKWLRSGRVRLDGRRCRPGDRVVAGQRVRVPPPSVAADHRVRRSVPMPSPAAAALASRVLYRDDDVIVLDKPAGLAVQGGSGVRDSVDAALDTLRFGGERPRLVHRLDKDTSGVLVLARTASVATHLTRAFRGRAVHKLYWAIVVGVPTPTEGRIEAPLRKRAGHRGERVELDAEAGRPAVTRYRVIERAGRRVAWVELEPLTGRTHQLRVHCVALGMPILGDGKYGGPSAFLGDLTRGVRLHLHAREIRVPMADRRQVVVRAPLPDDLRTSWRLFGFRLPDDGTRSARS